MECDDEMVTCELEAAEVLARLARCSDAEAIAMVDSSSQDPAIAVQQSCGYTTDTVTIAGNSEQTAQTAGFRGHSAGKSRQNTNEDEKEARKLRRILANRESARQTIRRRQAMYLELTRKAADLTDENENLKREMEHALSKYNSLKDRNAVLKTQMGKIKKAEKRDPLSKTPHPQAEASTNSATTSNPSFLYNNQPSFVPCFWPSVLPSSDLIQFHPEIVSSPQFMMPNRDMQPYSHQGITRPGTTPFFLVLVPWLLPFLAQNTMVHTNDRQNEMTSQTQQCSTCSSSETLMLEENTQLSLNTRTRTDARYNLTQDKCGQCTSRHHMHEPGMSSSVRPVESVRHVEAYYTVNPSEIMTPVLGKKSRDPVCQKPEEASAAAEARKRRKELLKLKNVHCHPNVHVRD